MATTANRTNKTDDALPLDDDRHLPPRRVIHSADGTKGTRLFQASLVVLLILLAAGMIFWYGMYGGE